MSKRKSALRAKKLPEQIHLWKEHFKNLLGKSSKVMDEPILKIINNQPDIKQGQFTQEELYLLLTKIKS